MVGVLEWNSSYKDKVLMDIFWAFWGAKFTLSGEPATEKIPGIVFSIYATDPGLVGHETGELGELKSCCFLVVHRQKGRM